MPPVKKSKTKAPRESRKPYTVGVTVANSATRKASGSQTPPNLFHSRSKDEDMRYLSNFQEIDGGLFVPLWGTVPSVEHAFQLCKTGFMKPIPGSKVENGVEKLRELIMLSKPDAAKRLGGKTKTKAMGLFLDVDAWNSKRVTFMTGLLRGRFKKDERFRNIIKNSPSKEFYHYDRAGAKSFWGGYVKKDTGVWVGENTLGEIMTQLKLESINGDL